MSGIAQDAVETRTEEQKSSVVETYKAQFQEISDRICDGEPFAIEIVQSDVDGAICGLTPVRVALSRYGFEDVDDQTSQIYLWINGQQYGFKMAHEDHFHWSDTMSVGVGGHELTPVQY